MSEIQYITWDELLHVYEKTVDESGGGFSGIRDRERLESVLEFVQNDLYYPTFEDKLTFLCHASAQDICLMMATSECR